MQVILTPTAVADKFGVGLNGFADSVPGPPTALSEQWFDSVQMEIVNVIIGQGIALDGLVFDQLKQAIDDYTFVNPSVEAGGSLTISNGATLYLAPGSLFFADDTSSFSVNTADAEFLKDLTIGDSSGDALIVTSTSTFQSAVFFNGNVDIGNNVADALTVNATATFNENVTVSTATLTVPTIDQTDSAGSIATGEVRFYSDATPTGTNGVMQFGGRYLALGFGGTAKKVAVIDEDWVAGTVTTTNPIDDTGAEVVIVLAAGDIVMVEVSYEAKNATATNNVNVRIEANGVAIGGTDFHRPPANDVYMPCRRVVEYTAAASIAYTFKARFGGSGLTLVTARNIHIAVRHRH
jgi:hypothetical protein